MKRDALKGRESFHLTIPADENNLSEVRDFISEICRRAGFSKREINNTKLAMDEACTNIIKHAYRDISGEIRIDVDAGPGKVEINIFDQGTPFDWSQVKDPDLQQYVEIGKKGGLGIFLMNRLMDDLDYRSTGEGNRLYMLKTAHGAGAAHEPLFISIRPKWTSTLRFKFAMRATLGLFGLVVFLFAIQYVNQTREIEDLENQAWMNMRSIAWTIESKAENALMIDDPYDPQYRELTEFLLERVMKMPAVRYARILNDDGTIVASSTIEEFMRPGEIPSAARDLPVEGVWLEAAGPGGAVVRELQIPVLISRDDAAATLPLGRVVLGVSEQVIQAQIYDPRLKTGLILAGIFLVGVSLIYLLISVFVKPIQALTDGVRAIGAGSLEDEIRIDGPEEIGEIARAFNEITGRFREAQKSVVEQERFQKEMQVAQEIQHSLLPGRVPKISGYDIASLYRAAKEVGGDYYDFVKVDEDTLGVVVADVSGKGVPGSLVMTMIRTALRMEARGSHSAADVMSRMNDFVTEDMKKGMFVTIFYVILDSKNRIISYASAGHNPMILFRAETDETFFLNPRGFPVGISLPDETLFRRSIDVEKIKLKKDDMLVIYTDGVTEAMNESREQYGEDRLLSLLRRCGRMSPEDFMKALNEDIARFTEAYPQNDDITVVAIKEKLMADDVLFGIRKKLLDLVDVEGFTVAEACARMKVSPSTYYRYRKRLTELGERGLKNKTLRTDQEIKRVNLEQRKELLEIIREDPRLGAKRIASRFNEGRPEEDLLTASLVYDELKRMRLNTYEKRLEYLRRNRFITEEEFQARLAGEAAAPAREQAPVPAEEIEAAGAGPTVEEPAAAASAQTTGPPAAPEHAAGREPEEDPVERLLREVLGSAATEARLVEVSARNDEEGIIVLAVRGHLDSNAAGELEEFLESLSEYGFSKFVMDLTDVSYISSGGWGIFTGRVKTLRGNGGDIVLAGMSPEVFDIYELLGFQDIIMHLRHADEAVDFIQLPIDARKRRLEEVSGTPTTMETIERRMSVAEPDAAREDGAPAEWSALRIAAGTVGERGEITVLELDGVIDTVSCLRLREVLEDLVAKKVRRFVIDMSLVEYVSSAGWGVFASRIDEVRRDGGDIKVFGMDPEVDSIFHMLGFDVIMRSFSILSEAIDDFRQPVEAPVAAAGAPSRSGAVLTRGTDRDAGSSLRRTEPSAAPPPGGDTTVPPVDLRLDTRWSENGESVVLRPAGALDASTTDEFETRLDAALARRPEYVVIDLAEVIYISSSGWGVIVKCLQGLAARGGRVALTGMRQPIFKIFRDLGFEPLIPHYLTSAKALEEFCAPEVMEKREPDDPAATESIPETQAGTGAIPPAEAPARGVEDPGTAPSIPRRGVTPLGAERPEVAPLLDVKLDLTGRDGDPDVSGERVRRIGWKDYGERLRERDRKRSGRK